MRLKNAEYVLLRNVLTVVEASGRSDLVAGLRAILTRFEATQAKTREANRIQAAKRRAAEREKWGQMRCGE